MNAQQIRKAYLDFFSKRAHTVIPRALLVPQNDPTTLFTGSGMQPLIPYLLGEEHPYGTRLVDSQPCLRVQDIEQAGDNRHTTFFEMLGNWSLGDYFKKEQIPWFWEFLTDVIKLDPSRIYVTCFIGDQKADVPKDIESAQIWTDLFKKAGVDTKQVDIGSEEDGYRQGEQGGRIFFYSDKNWWSRAGAPKNMPVGEPGGPTTEMFYQFDDQNMHGDWVDGLVSEAKKKHTHTEQEIREAYANCHPNCDCGRYIELGNSVFMGYVKTKDGVAKLPKQNVDYGGGLERIAMAAINSSDVYKISLLWPIVQRLEELSGKKYTVYTNAMRVIADHLRGATFLAADGVVPSNKEQGYVMRRLMRRAIRFAFDLGVEQDLCAQIVPVVADIYHDDYPEVAERRQQVIDVLVREEKIFRQTLRKGLREFDAIARQKMSGEYNTGTKVPEQKSVIFGSEIFKLYDTFGFPIELSVEEAFKRDINLADDWQQKFDHEMEHQRLRSKTATKGTFKGGLADHSEITTKYHTATHLMYRALNNVLGDHVQQRGSNITAERIRFDFTHPEKVTPEQIKQIEDMVNQQIKKDWPVSWREEKTKDVLGKVLGAFGDRYGDMVKVYTVGDPDGVNYSREICGGPHVQHTGVLGEHGKIFKILKEEASSAGVRRIKAALV